MIADTSKIYGFLTLLKTAQSITKQEFASAISIAENEFKSGILQYLNEENSNLLLNAVLHDLNQINDYLSSLAKHCKRSDHIDIADNILDAHAKCIESIQYIQTVFPEAHYLKQKPDEGELAEKTTETNEHIKVISGTKGLAKYLGCGKSMAFSIIQNGILKDSGIQYKVGNCWKFNAKKLDEYLKKHPELLGKIRCIR